MSKKIILTVLALVMPASVFAAETDPLKDIRFQDSPFEVCKDVTMITDTDFKKNEDFWKTAIGECGIDIQVMPDTGFFQTIASSLREGDTATSSLEFLKRVGDRAGKYVALNNELTDHLRHCALKDKAWFQQKAANAKSVEEREFYDFDKCENAVAKIKDAVKEIGPKARVQRAVIEATRSVAGDIGAGLKWATGTRLEIESMPISAAEKAEADKIVAAEEAEVKKEFDALVKKNMEKLEELQARQQKAMAELRSGKHADKPAGQELLDAMNKPLDSRELDSWFKGWWIETNGGKNPNSRLARPYVDKATLPKKNEILAKHKQDFLKHLQDLPVLAYLGTANPSDADIAKAAAKVLANGQEELKDIQAKLAKASAAHWPGGRGKLTPTQAQRAEALFDFMKYGPVVQEILKEDPMSCRTGTGIANMILSSKSRQNAALIVGMIGTMGAAAVVGPAVLGGAAIASPALLAAGVGLGFGVGITVSDYADYARAKQRTFSVVETIDQGKAVADIQSFEEARDMFTLAAALSPVDLIGTGIFLKSGAVVGFTMGKLLEKPASKLALTNALKRKGLRDLEIERLFKDLQSSNPEVARAAARKIITEGGIDENQIKFVRLAASKGLFLEQNPAAMSAVLKEVKDGKVYMRAMKILEDVNSAKINAGNRDMVLKAAVAGADFGVTDPKKLAAVINDWDQGLDGLARTYELAKSKMAMPDVRGLASVEARQQAAFSKALDELMDANPEFKALKPSERAAAKEQMMACGVKGI